MEERSALIEILNKQFIADLVLCAKSFTQEETIDFVCVLKEYLKGIYNDEPTIAEFNYDGNPFDGETFIELNLLKPYRDKMIPFVSTNLKYYFAKDDYTKELLFKKLGIDEPILSEDEYHSYIFTIYSILQKVKENLYLRPIENIKIQHQDVRLLMDNEDELSNQGFKSRSKEYTRSRQVLLYYFILKLMGITKLENSSRKLAQFAHVLFAYPIDNIDNSGIYKLLKKAPYLKKDDKAMLIDLEFVKEQFELIDSKEGVALVQKEIDLIKK